MFPSIDPYETGLLDVGDGQSLCWECCGNPTGTPAVVLHGGPGSGCTPGLRQFFDPTLYRISSSTSAVGTERASGCRRHRHVNQHHPTSRCRHRASPGAPRSRALGRIRCFLGCHSRPCLPREASGVHPRFRGQLSHPDPTEGHPLALPRDWSLYPRHGSASVTVFPSAERGPGPRGGLLPLASSTARTLTPDTSGERLVSMGGRRLPAAGEHAQSPVQRRRLSDDLRPNGHPLFVTGHGLPRTYCSTMHIALRRYRQCWFTAPST